MQITLTPEQEAFVQQALSAGRIDRPEDALTEALLLWEEREVLRSELIASLNEARASIARGDGRIITKASMQALADEAKQRLRSRLATEQPRWTSISSP
jgi:Arc/MetJ-type ribon-helix-helix transcriptional regulator